MSKSINIAGGPGGTPFTDYAVPQQARISELRIYASQYIDAVQLVYTTADGETAVMPRIGGLGGEATLIPLADDEYITGISGRCGWYIDQMRIHTNKRVTETMGGTGGFEDFALAATPGNAIVGFHGRCDWFIDALGIITRSLAKQQPDGSGETAAAPTAETAVSTSVKTARPQDLQKVSGIGPKIAGLLIDNGILDLADLANTPVKKLSDMLQAAGRRYATANPNSWPDQAALGAAGDWAGLAAHQETLKNSR